MTIYRNINNQRLYELYELTRTGQIESVDLFTAEKRKLNQSSWKKEDFIPLMTKLDLKLAREKSRAAEK